MQCEELEIYGILRPAAIECAAQSPARGIGVIMLEAPAPAKLNLGLHVLRHRSDGYHDLDTVFVRIPWSDRIEVTIAPGISMTCTDPSLPVDDDNLCLRAAALLAREARCAKGVRIRLDKRIPHGAGLGGGSSDAATTLRLLLRLWGVTLSAERLSDLALQLGSDVPFFLGPPAARGEGRGNELTPIPMPPALRRSILVVAVPPVFVSTAKAFALVRPHDDDRPDLVSVVSSASAVSWRGTLVNDFQIPISQAEPSIATVLNVLEGAGAEYSSLSGSGSAVFGLFPGEDPAESAGRTLQALSCRVWIGRAGDPPGLSVRSSD